MLQTWRRLTNTSRKSSTRHTTRLLVDRLEDRTVPVRLSMYIDYFNSQLTISGDLGGSPIMQQGPGSLRTSYFGDIQADYDATASTLSLDLLSYAGAFDSGNWAPLPNGDPGTGPASYGGVVAYLGDVDAAIHNLFLGVFTVAPMALTPDGMGGYNFNSEQYVGTYYGSLAYRHRVLPLSGTRDASNLYALNLAAAGSFTDYGAGYYFLRMPISTTLIVNITKGIDVTLNFTGELQCWAYPSGPIGGGGGPRPTPDFAPALGYLTIIGMGQVEPTPLTNSPVRQITPADDQPADTLPTPRPAAETPRPSPAAVTLDQVFTNFVIDDLMIGG